jgi:DNA-binding NtrC family response regulator
MKPLRILLVDDDPDVHDFMAVALEQEHVQLHGATSAEAALARIGDIAPDLILLDLILPGMDGRRVLQELRQRGVEAPVIVITSHGSMDAAVAVVEAGALDVMTKPVRVPALLDLLAGLRSPRYRAGDQSGHAPGSGRAGGEAGETALIGKSPQMMEVYKAIGRVAKTNATVLIQGESGTGKELVARAIHRYSRRPGAFVAVNCAAVPETLLESELFGHEKGAFTGAVASKPGKLERAGKGTFFLDEVGDMPLALQAKILRVLDDNRIERLGGTNGIELDLRLVSATHHQLHQRVEQARFRQDLYFRLAVVPIRLPPLRERAGDIRLLIDHYLVQLGARFGRALTGVHPEVYERFENYPWPGNVRELRNVVERSIILSRGPILDPSVIPELNTPAASDAPFDQLVVEGRDLQDVERGYIERVLHIAGGNLSEAARRLGIHRNTLRRKVRSYQATAPIQRNATGSKSIDDRV